MAIEQLPAPQRSEQGGPISADWNKIIGQINERIAGDYGSYNARPFVDVYTPTYQLPSTWNRVWGFLDLMLQMCNNYGTSIDRYNIPFTHGLFPAPADGLTKRIFDLITEAHRIPSSPEALQNDFWYNVRVKQRKAFTSAANDFFEWKNPPHPTRTTQDEDIFDDLIPVDALQGYGHIWGDNAMFSLRPNAKIMGELLSLWVGMFANGTAEDKEEPYQIKNIALPFQQLMDERQFRLADIYTYKELDENGDPALDENGEEIIHEEIEINNANPTYTHEDEEPTDENPEPKKYRIFEIIGTGKYRLVNDDDEERDPIVKEVDIDGYLWLGEDEGGWRTISKNDAVDSHEARVILLEPRKPTFADACMMAFIYLCPTEYSGSNVNSQKGLWQHYFSDSVLAQVDSLTQYANPVALRERPIDVGQPIEVHQVGYPVGWDFPTVRFRRWLINRFGDWADPQEVDLGINEQGANLGSWTAHLQASFNSDMTELKWEENISGGFLSRQLHMGEYFRRLDLKDDETEFVFKRRTTTYRGKIIDKKIELEEDEQWDAGGQISTRPRLLPYITFKLDRAYPAGIDAPTQWVRLIEGVAEDDPPNRTAEDTDTRAFAYLFNEAYLYLRCIAPAFCDPETKIVTTNQDGETVDVPEAECDDSTAYVIRDLTVERYAELLGFENFGGDDRFGILPNTKYKHEVMRGINDAVNKLSHIRVIGLTLDVRATGSDYIYVDPQLIRSRAVGQPQTVLANIHDYINGDTDRRRGRAYWQPNSGAWIRSVDGLSWTSDSFAHPGLVGTSTPIPEQVEERVTHFESSPAANTMSLRVGSSNELIYVGSEMEVRVYDLRHGTGKYSIEFNSPIFRQLSTAGQRTITVSVNPFSIFNLGRKVSDSMKTWLRQNTINNVIIRVSNQFTGDNPTSTTCQFGRGRMTFDLSPDYADERMSRVRIPRLPYPSFIDQYDPPRPVRSRGYVAMALSHIYENEHSGGTYEAFLYDTEWRSGVILFSDSGGRPIPYDDGDSLSPAAVSGAPTGGIPLSEDRLDFQRYGLPFQYKRAISIDGRSQRLGVGLPVTVATPLQVAVPIS